MQPVLVLLQSVKVVKAVYQFELAKGARKLIPWRDMEGTDILSLDRYILVFNTNIIFENTFQYPDCNFSRHSIIVFNTGRLYRIYVKFVQRFNWAMMSFHNCAIGALILHNVYQWFFLLILTQGWMAI